MMNCKNPEGFLFVNKPEGITSFDCIRHLQRILGKSVKIGHAGTLDPFASGLMIIAVGRSATKKLSIFSSLPKEYVASAKLGELTDTLDLTGVIIQQEEGLYDAQTLQDVVAAFEKNYVQTPPFFSALKFQGVALYKLARRKEYSAQELAEICVQKQRKVTIYDLQIESLVLPFFSIKATVSAGTYIRSLANDIAQKVGTYATTYHLQRTRIGSTTLDQAISLASIQTVEQIHAVLQDLT